MDVTVPKHPIKRLRYFPVPTLPARRLRQTYHAHLHNGETGGFEAGGAIGHIRLDGGKLFVDDLPVLKPRIAEDAISWHQHVDGHYTSGQLSFGRGRTELHGIVSRGTTPEDAVAHQVLATTIAPVDWSTKITTRRFPAGTEPPTLPDSDWVQGLTVSIGYKQSIGDEVPRPVVLLGGEDISESILWSIDPKTQETVLKINLEPMACEFNPSLYLTARLNFNYLKVSPTCSGTVETTCADQQSSKETYLWTGAVASPKNAAALAGPPEPMALTTADLKEDSSLSVAELISLTPDASVTEQSNSMVVENMKWAMGADSTESEWLSNFLGEKRPTIEPTRQKLVNENLSWYQNQFAKSYFSFAFQNYSGANAPTDRLDEAEALKLKSFLKTGIGKEEAFTKQQNGIYIQAFLEAKPRLRAYLQDGGQKWAKELYEAITAPAQMVLMVNRVYSSGEPNAMAPVNNWATLLTALQGTGEGYAKQYVEQITAAALSKPAHETAWTDKETVMEWLPEWLKVFLASVATSDTVPDEAKLAAKQAEEMLAQLGGDYTNLAAELSDFIINANGATLLEKTRNGETALVAKWPKLEKVGKMLFFMGWSMGLMMVVKAFQNWKNLTPEQKASAVLTTVQLGLTLLESLPSLIEGVKEMGLAGWNKFLELRSGAPANEEVIEMNQVDSESGEWLGDAMNETTPLMNAGAGTIDAAGTFWARIFANAVKVIAVIGVLLSAAFAVLSTIEFIKDLQSGAPLSKKIFDGILMTVNIAVTVCLVLDLFLATTVFALAAPVLAVIGVVVMLIEMFVVKPPNPLTEFMDNVAKPFVASLPAQAPSPSESTALVFS